MVKEIWSGHEKEDDRWIYDGQTDRQTDRQANRRTDNITTNNIILPVLRWTRGISVVVVLRPRQTSKVMSGRSVNLTTLFLGRLRPPKRLTSTSCTYFRQ